MSRSLPVSAVIITLDAERHLGAVLRSVSACDEIVVLDSGSSDRTREIAAAHGARWHEHPFDGYGPQKNRAVALASHDRILSLDADEVLDETARAALLAVDWGAADVRACWRLRRRNFIGDREIRHGHWGRDRVVRLFDRTVHGFTDVAVHEAVVPIGPVYDLPGCLLHYSYPDAAALFRPDYHRRKAERYRAAGRRASPPVLVARAFWAFGSSYVLRRGFLDGRLGVVVALAAAVNATVGLATASGARRSQPGREDGRRPQRR
jgi:glycosyltransferase involved in cell wall biosynthesis